MNGLSSNQSLSCTMDVFEHDRDSTTTLKANQNMTCSICLFHTSTKATFVKTWRRFWSRRNFAILQESFLMLKSLPPCSRLEYFQCIASIFTTLLCALAAWDSTFTYHALPLQSSIPKSTVSKQEITWKRRAGISDPLRSHKDAKNQYTPAFVDRLVVVSIMSSSFCKRMRPYILYEVHHTMPARNPCFVAI